MKKRRCPNIQRCERCGQMRINHLPQMTSIRDCPVPDEVLAALRIYRRENGKSWKSKLTNAWTAGHNLGQELQQAWNMIGPRRLYAIDLDHFRSQPKRIA